MTRLSHKTIAKNVSLSVVAQIISLLASFVLNLVVPKFVPEIEYSMWQTYVLYASFVGIFHFGLLDGFVLKYSKYDYDELDKEKMLAHTQFLVVVLLLSSIAFFSVFVLNGHCNILCILVSAAIFLKNMCVFASYTFQTTNRIGNYAKLVITQRLIYAALVFLLLFLGMSKFWLFCVADLVGELSGFLISIKYNRAIYFGTFSINKTTVKIVKNTLSCGCLLMIANFSNNFIVGSCKMAIERLWDKLTFGHASFAFSVSNLFLTFVISISVVLFPSIKRMNPDKIVVFYRSIRTLLSQVLYFVLVLYFPAVFALRCWLPMYSDSTHYLGVLFPIILFSTRTTLLTNNYLKALRLEKVMFFINIFAVVLEVTSLFLCYYAFRNIEALLIATIAVTFFKTFISESIISRYLKISYKLFSLEEFVISCMFVYVVLSLNLMQGSIITFISILIVSLMNLRKVKNAINTFQRL